MPLPELELIERIRSVAGRGLRGGTRLGSLLSDIGDDCAILRGSANEDLLVTTDFSIEGVHFRRRWHPAESVGHRCVARGFSDIAAMGGEPVAAFLALAVSERTSQQWIDGFMAGFLPLARRYKVQLAGGDTSASPRAIAADVIVLGRVPRGKAILRSGARPGDAIYVTGNPGSAAAVLRRLRRGEQVSAGKRESAPHFFPEPRIAVGRWLRERDLASAMIDVSDGISSDLAHICDESKAAAVISETALGRTNQEIEDALYGGEDYELLFTARARANIPAKIAGIRVRRIGEIVSPSLMREQMMLIASDGKLTPLRAAGWLHFGRQAR